MIFILLFYSFPSRSQSFGDGRDGSPLISSVINRYAYLVKDAARCDGILEVNDGSLFSSGDLVLVIQMCGTQIDSTNNPSYGNIIDYRNSGNFEYAGINSVTGNTLFLKYALARNYTTAGKTQVIKVPQYENPVITGTLTCKPWDGTTGGVLVLDVTGTASFNANINISDRGFRGGKEMNGEHVMALRYEYVSEPDPVYFSFKGESIAGQWLTTINAGRGAPANGGGGGNVHTSGGGGGSGGGYGGNGGWGYPVDLSGNEKSVFGIGGYALNNPPPDKIFMGGGGGAGHEHFSNGTDGANGGGILFITCTAIEGNGFSIFANGGNSESSGAYGDGTGGAGGGGYIFIHSQNILSPFLLYADGGNGGSSVDMGFGPGGGGGGGSIMFNQPSLPSTITTISVVGGKGGIAGGIDWGASDGGTGTVLFNNRIIINDSIPPVSAGFYETYLTMADIQFSNLSSGAISYSWDFGDGQSSGSYSPLHKFEGAGDYEVALVAFNEWGCTDTVKKIITVIFPNVFTPNGDGINDFFYFNEKLDSGRDFDFHIFNRWGVRLFHGTKDNPVWDGKTTWNTDAPEGTYYYILEIPGSGDIEKRSYSGFVMLMR
ncbi:MAG: gliding motility-associated C-terminal domain-containing protein [Bacteroidetes bacterium]|nr:gliding motility-associated C-terminal domain-containing protein [Bacteroidota bacterium]